MIVVHFCRVIWMASICCWMSAMHVEIEKRVDVEDGLLSDDVVVVL